MNKSNSCKRKAGYEMYDLPVLLMSASAEGLNKLLRSVENTSEFPNLKIELSLNNPVCRNRNSAAMLTQRIPLHNQIELIKSNITHILMNWSNEVHSNEKHIHGQNITFENSF